MNAFATELYNRLMSDPPRFNMDDLGYCISGQASIMVGRYVSSVEFSALIGVPIMAGHTLRHVYLPADARDAEAAARRLKAVCDLYDDIGPAPEIIDDNIDETIKQSVEELCLTTR